MDILCIVIVAPLAGSGTAGGCPTIMLMDEFSKLGGIRLGLFEGIRHGQSTIYY